MNVLDGIDFDTFTQSFYFPFYWTGRKLTCKWIHIYNTYFGNLRTMYFFMCDGFSVCMFKAKSLEIWSSTAHIVQTFIASKWFRYEINSNFHDIRFFLCRQTLIHIKITYEICIQSFFLLENMMSENRVDILYNDILISYLQYQ